MKSRKVSRVFNDEPYKCQWTNLGAHVPDAGRRVATGRDEDVDGWVQRHRVDGR